jgi:ferrous iron transport protein B
VGKSVIFSRLTGIEVVSANYHGTTVEYRAGKMKLGQGMGCSVPAVLSVRSLDSPKQRYLAATLMTMAIPCASQSAMILGVLAPFGLRYIAAVYIALLFDFVAAGPLLHRVVGGESPELFLEIPP